MIANYKRFLLLAPHTDDAELGCGGTIAKFLEEKAEIYVAVFSTAEKSVPKGFPKTVLRDEFYRAMSVLGIKKQRLTVYNYEVRKLSYSRQEVLEELITLRKKINPDMVFLPSSEGTPPRSPDRLQRGPSRLQGYHALGIRASVEHNHISYSRFCYS